MIYGVQILAYLGLVPVLFPQMELIYGLERTMEAGQEVDALMCGVLQQDYPSKFESLEQYRKMLLKHFQSYRRFRSSWIRISFNCFFHPVTDAIKLDQMVLLHPDAMNIEQVENFLAEQ